MATRVPGHVSGSPRTNTRKSAASMGTKGADAHADSCDGASFSSTSGGIRTTMLMIGLPLALSFVLMIVGIAVMSVVNSKYAAEAAESLPSTMVSSMSFFLRREVESEMRHARRVHSRIASSLAAELSDVPIEDYGSPRSVIPPGDARLRPAYARRREWHRQNSADQVRLLGSFDALAEVGLYYDSLAEAVWGRGESGVASETVGLTSYGADVAMGEAVTSVRQLHIEEYRPDLDLPTSPLYNASVDSSSTQYYIAPVTGYFIGVLDKKNAWQEHVVGERGFDALGVPLRDRVSQARFMYLLKHVPSSKETYVIHTYLAGALRSPTGRLVGMTEVIFDLSGLERSIRRVRGMVDAVSGRADWARYRSASFVLSADGYVLATSRGSAPLTATVTYLDPYNRASWPLPAPQHCKYTETSLLNGSTVVYLVCQKVPATYEDDPLIKASASHLPLLCRDRNPRLGISQRVQMSVDGGTEETFVVLCDTVDLGRDVRDFRANNFSSWRVVTIVGAREIVEPLLSGWLPRAVVVGAVGSTIAFVGLIVAAGISFYLARRRSESHELN